MRGVKTYELLLTNIDDVEAPSLRLLEMKGRCPLKRMAERSPGLFNWNPGRDFFSEVITLEGITKAGNTNITALLFASGGRKRESVLRGSLNLTMDENGNVGRGRTGRARRIRLLWL